MRLFVSVILCAVMFAACKSEYTKIEGGREYKIIESGSGDKIVHGDFLLLNIRQYVNTDVKDTTIRENPFDIPYVDRIDSSITDKEFYKLITQMRKGDSANVRVLVDSIFKDNMMNMPSFMKKGQYFITGIKVVDIIKDEKVADSLKVHYFIKAQELSQQKIEEQKKIEEDNIKTYLDKNGVTNSIRTENGVYVEIYQEGTGAIADTNNVLLVNYTGKTMSGVVFDSNTDPAFNHVDPLVANLTSDPTLGMPLISGWLEGLKYLNKGAKARLYIPSALAYGPMGSGDKIKPNETLIFDIEVLDVMDRVKGKAINAQMLEKFLKQQTDENKK